MGSEKTQKLPVIDFTKVNLSPNTSHWVSTRDQVQQTLVEYGCFVVKYDEILPEIHNQMFAEVKGIFDSVSPDINVQNTFADPCHYFRRPVVEFSSALEGFQLRDATKHEAVANLKSFIETVWPQGNDAFCDTFLSYAKMLAKLDQIVTKMVLESLGVDKYLESHVESTTYTLLALKYTASQNPTRGLQSHCDASLITILDTNHVKGLEIQTKDGEWLDYYPAPGHVVIMAGDALFGWSNGRIHSAAHRSSSGGEDRYTLKMASYARDLVEVPKELVDDEHPLLFKPFNNLEYAIFSKKRFDESADCNVLKTFCGV